MMSKTVRSAVVVAMIGAATLASMGIVDAAPPTAPDGREDEGDRRCAGSGRSRDAAERQIVGYLTEVLRDFDAAARPWNPFTGAKPPQGLDATTTTYTSGGGTRTVVAKVYRRMPGARPSTWYRSFSYHADERLTFDGLFRSAETALPVLASIVARTLSVELGQPVPVGLDPATFRNFAVTDDAVLFFFDQHQLHPALGATAVSVPRSAIAAMLVPGL